MKVNKTDYLANIVFIIMGVILLVITLYVNNTSTSKENRVETTGIITKIESYTDMRNERYYDVYVSYNVNGIEYVSILNVWIRGFYEGKEIEIYYDRNNPTKIGIAASDFMMIFFIILPTIFIIIGAYGIVNGIKKYKKKKHLKQTGDVIYANYVETIINYGYSVNKRHPYRIICEWDNPADNKRYIFESDNIWYNVENIINERNIDKIPVYINRDKIEEYVVDVEQVTKDIVDLT